MSVPHPWKTLRRDITQTASRFRNEDDISQSLFFPDGGFCYAYHMGKVEELLNAYEKEQFPEQDKELAVFLAKEAVKLQQNKSDEAINLFVDSVLQRLNQTTQTA